MLHLFHQVIVSDWCYKVFVVHMISRICQSLIPVPPDPHMQIREIIREHLQLSKRPHFMVQKIYFMRNTQIVSKTLFNPECAERIQSVPVLCLLCRFAMSLQAISLYLFPLLLLLQTQSFCWFKVSQTHSWNLLV